MVTTRMKRSRQEASEQASLASSSSKSTSVVQVKQEHHSTSATASTAPTQEVPRSRSTRSNKRFKSNQGGQSLVRKTRSKSRRSNNKSIAFTSIETENSSGVLDGDGESEKDEGVDLKTLESAATASAKSTSTDETMKEIEMDDGKEEEVQAVGLKNALNLPHMRQHCVDCQFVPDIRHKMILPFYIGNKGGRDIIEGQELDAKFCSKCYCYVCDKPASECPKWCDPKWSDFQTTMSTTSKFKTDSNLKEESSNSDSSTFTPKKYPHEWHCYASDKGPDAHFWKEWRDHVRNHPEDEDASLRHPCDRKKSDVSTWMNVAPSDSNESLSSRKRSINHQGREGPYPPNDRKASKNNHLTKCRKCGWYNDFEHRNFTRTMTINTGKRDADKNVIYKNEVNPHPHGCLRDWCHACGRIASKKDFEKKKSEPYNNPLDTLFGTQTFPFTIHSRDPRIIEPFDKNWSEHEGKKKWTYNEAEMEEDMFLHRMGKRPTIGEVLKCCPIVSPDDIPVTGTTNGNHTYWNYKLSALETEAVIFEDKNVIDLLQEMSEFSSSKSKLLSWDMQAHWDKKQRRGALNISLYLSQSAFSPSITNDFSFARLLATWFGISFKLSELTHVPCQVPSRNRREDLLNNDTGLVPKNIPRQEKPIFSSMTESGKDIMNNYNDEAKEVTRKYQFVSSSRTPSGGGVCGSDCSFRGLLGRYFSEMLNEDSMALGTPSRNRQWRAFGLSDVGRSMGIKSSHRHMCRNQGGREIHTSGYDKICEKFTSYVRAEDQGLVLHNMTKSAMDINARYKSFHGLLQCLENLGHSAVDDIHTEGLNVSLFDFQSQAVSWALGREQAPYGLNSFLWAKVPGNEELYFSPLLNEFRSSTPPIIRGGIIGEEMGLGKTIISLALVLLNPAPVHGPESGVLVSDWFASKKQGTTIETTNDDNDDVYSSWPSILTLQTPPGTTAALSGVQEEGPDIPDLIEGTGCSDKAGTIISRGTLVVCNVSLVGQWVDEAKSKLKDPGLVYSYHGQGRKRDASVLARNAVVVTTYSTLASDINFWYKKSKDKANYIAPCEEIQWWRIICDESHALKDMKTVHFKALSNLRAEHKWCVTGTPVNTSLNDLKGQMNFIGMDNVNQLFKIFADKMCHDLFGKKSRRNRFESDRCVKKAGDFLFLMRNIAIRHSIKQQRISSGTDLMSLPDKEEIIIRISFTDEERKEYDKLEKSAMDQYNQLKRSTSNINRHYLRLQACLTPLRVACSGGFAENEVDERAKKAASMATEKIKPFKLGGQYSTECIICLQPMINPHVTTCKPIRHAFCHECIVSCINVSPQCPVCRAKLKVKDLQCAEFIDEDEDSKEADDNEDTVSTDEGNEDYADCDKRKAKKKKKEKYIQDVPFKSKFNRLLDELKTIRDNEPEGKSLVFSQFASTLQWMKQELPKHGFNFRTLSGDMNMSSRAKALRSFQQDPPTTIFLLSMRAGACGINLTQANRVFLMEPAMNPALESQAVGRVYRLGQRNPVKIIKFYMENSIETRLLRVVKKKYGIKDDKKENEEDDVKPSETTIKDEQSGNEDKDENENEDRKLPALTPTSVNSNNNESSSLLATASAASAASTTSAASAVSSPSTSAVVGHMKTDKGSMLQEEFDFLFGVHGNFSEFSF